MEHCSHHVQYAHTHTLIHTNSSNLQLLEASLNTMSEVFSHVKDIESWSLCQELFTFLCVLLDEKMAADAGKVSIIKW